MTSLRKLGYQVSVFLKSNSFSNEKAADASGLSENQIQRLLEGRFFVSIEQLRKIAALKIGTNVSSFLSEPSESNYPEMIHCMSEFKKTSDCDDILDLIDAYADLEEALE